MKQRSGPRSATLWACGARRLLLAALTAGAVGCTAADDSKLPPDIQDPASLKTPAGAIARYKSAAAFMAGTLDRMITASGIITDELASTRAPSTASGTMYTPADARTGFGELSRINFAHLNQLRADAREARGFLTAYAPDSSPALAGHLAALEGYADIFLADLFCSGIPLSTVNFDGSYTLAAGSTTSQVYEQAVALFDSALALTNDSVAFQRLAAVGKGRALLALGRFDEAASAVAGVPDDYAMPLVFVFDIQPMPDGQYAPADSAALWSFVFSYPSTIGVPFVGDREGLNGLDYRTSGDPRAATVALGTSPTGDTMYFPVKYTLDIMTSHPFDSLQLASGIEARLIEAEAALRASPDGGQWLTILNHLRQAAWPTIKPAVSGPLPDLADPGSATARVDLLFRERAFWLFLTGHRQGDLRRLLRQYPGRVPSQVYPSGPFAGGGSIPMYGDSIVVAPPLEERGFNPKYTGCIHGNA